MTKNDDEKILDEIKNRELLLAEEHKRIPKRKNKEYKAEITVKGKKIHVGFFDTKEEAIEAIKEAKRKYLDEI